MYYCVLFIGTQEFLQQNPELGAIDITDESRCKKDTGKQKKYDVGAVVMYLLFDPVVTSIYTSLSTSM